MDSINNLNIAPFKNIINLLKSKNTFKNDKEMADSYNIFINGLGLDIEFDYITFNKLLNSVSNISSTNINTIIQLCLYE